MLCIFNLFYQLILSSDKDIRKLIKKLILSLLAIESGFILNYLTVSMKCIVIVHSLHVEPQVTL